MKRYMVLIIGIAILAAFYFLTRKGSGSKPLTAPGYGGMVGGYSPELPREAFTAPQDDRPR